MFINRIGKNARTHARTHTQTGHPIHPSGIPLMYVLNERPHSGRMLIVWQTLYLNVSEDLFEGLGLCSCRSSFIFQLSGSDVWFI